MKFSIVKTTVLTALTIFTLSAAEAEEGKQEKKICKATCTSHCCNKKSEQKSCKSAKSTVFDTQEYVDDHHDLD